MNVKNAVLSAIMMIVLVGCSSGGSFGSKKDSATSSSSASGGAIIDGADKNRATEATPAATLYNDALAKLNNGDFKSAAKGFAEVERQYPYSQLATKALLMQAYAYYQRSSFDDANNASKRFIALHPGHKDIAYAYYLNAISYYKQISSVGRDQSIVQKSLDALEEVARRFPGTAYAQDAQRKALICRNQLAAKEMEIGRYYQEKSSYLAAINRFKRIITDYQSTIYTPEALYRVAEAYSALGVRSEARTAVAVLGHNFPNSQWYRDARRLPEIATGTNQPQNTGSWIGKAFSRQSPTE